MKQWLYRFILPALIFPIYALLRLTWRVREHGDKQLIHDCRKANKPAVYAHWHRDELVLVGYFAFRKIGILSSLSNDGTLMANTLTLLGYKVFRGSSSRGGARGLIALIKATKAGIQSGLAVDGPKGPIFEVKPGIVDLAERTGSPLVCLRTKADRAWYIPKAWNKSYLPKPFAKVDVYFADAIITQGEAWQKLTMDEKCAQIKKTINSLG